MKLLSLCTALSLGALASAQTAGLSIQTTYGPIVGTYTSPTVRTFLGIPFASALRWGAPAAPKAWTAPLNTTDFGPTCFNSNFTADLGNTPIVIPPPPSEAEDCLSINVWAPPPSTGFKPVLLWVYGGGFEIGGTYTPFYNGANLVRDQKDVLVVSFNYRLNVFGFPAAADILPPKEANPGLLDVRAAVEWTVRNIARFGGDPTKITLFGESAGGAAVDSYLYAHPALPLINGAILQSGTIAITTGSRLGQDPRESWTKLTAHFDCADASTQLTCMRAVPAKTLRDTINTQNLTFTPIADNGTVFSAALTAARLAAGLYARVPVLIGSNDAEIPGQKLLSDIVFTCPAAATAAGHALRVPTWQYRFFGNFTGIGAFHGSEVTQVFGTFPNATTSTEQRESSKYIQGAWAAFARNPEAGLTGLGWPKFNPANKTLVGLAVGNKASIEVLSPATYHAVCATLPTSE